MEQPDLDYEATFRRLEEIADLLERGSLPLEQSLKLFEEGTRLTGALTRALDQAEQKLTTMQVTSNKE
ncbi:MAG: exodeoxyribonuclease VII small subunit [Oscillospiraceae bacterium]|jgi:exodeoxyribonuclease VII small subunit|nr:exodeoxyribonuclease VII small subunit [Oscillospiraceae bacterium]